MKLYQYTFLTYNDYRAKLDVLEVVEKPKTYETMQHGYGVRINKNDINKLIGFAFNVVILTEPNFHRAKELFLRSIESKIRMKKDELQRLEQNYEVFSSIEEPAE